MAPARLRHGRTIIDAVFGPTSLYRPATTPLDHHRYPATGLLTLYHQRWEIQTAFRTSYKAAISINILLTHQDST